MVNFDKFYGKYFNQIDNDFLKTLFTLNKNPSNFSFSPLLIHRSIQQSTPTPTCRKQLQRQKSANVEKSTLCDVKMVLLNFAFYSLQIFSFTLAAVSFWLRIFRLDYSSYSGASGGHKSIRKIDLAWQGLRDCRDELLVETLK